MLPNSAFTSHAEYLAYLRDWFAGQALIGLAGNTRLLLGIDKQSKGDPRGGTAAIAYSLADAMLAERERQP